MASLRQATVLTPGPTGLCRGREPEIRPERSGGIEAGQVSQCRHSGDRHGALHTAQSLEGLAHRGEAPGFYWLMACECQPPQTCRLCRDGLDVCLQDHWLRGGGTEHHAEPAQVRWTPGGAPGRAESVPQPAG